MISLKKLTSNPYFYLTLIIILAIFLRFYKLGEIPGSLNRDEAALGYNAYSILKTGKDEFGNYHPMTFVSFGDYKLPGYIYGSIPFISLFGLTTISIRMLSAISGVLLVLVIYGLSMTLFKNKNIALLSALSLTLAPWAIFYSRVGFETNVATLFFTTAIWLLILGLKNRFFWIISAFLMVLSLFIYNNPYIVGPILLLSFLILNFSKIYQHRKSPNFIIAFIILSLGSLIALKTVWGVSAAKTNVTIFKNAAIVDKFFHIRGEHNDLGIIAKVLARTVDSKYIYWGRQVVNNLLLDFSPQYLVDRMPEHIWNGVEGVGHIYIFEYLLIWVGLFLIWKHSKNFNKYFLTIWFIFGMIPAALTVHKMQPNRTLLSFIIIPIFVAYAINWFLEKYGKKIIYIFLIFYIGGLSLFWDKYFILFPQNNSGWYAGYGQFMQEIEEKHKLGYTIYLSERLEVPYIFYLFYNRIDPNMFQIKNQKTIDDEGFIKVYQFGDNIHVLPLRNLNNIVAPKYLVAGYKSENYFSEGNFDLEIKRNNVDDYVYKLNK